MPRRMQTSRAKQRQELLYELASQETIHVTNSSEIRAIEAIKALQRIHDGTYGVCTDCGRNIPAGRLQVKPEATRCVVCQSEYEERTALREGDWYDVQARSA